MLHLQEMIKYGQQANTVTLSERLPTYLAAPCQLQVTYQVEMKDDFYLIQLHVTADLAVQCQRCLGEFIYPYDNRTEVAVCSTDERAEQVLEHYECIVSANFQVRLEDVLIDELHLYAPQFHYEMNECNSETNQILMGIK